jgi:hypothetical protein
MEKASPFRAKSSKERDPGSLKGTLESILFHLAPGGAQG